jgi:hypothetical protein
MALDPLINITEATFDGGNPSELDYLRPNGFKFQVHNIPNVAYFCQSANIPDMTLGFATVNTPLVDYSEPGEKLQFGELNIRFLIQENLQNYLELYNWLRGLGFPESHNEYKEFIEKQNYRQPSSVQLTKMRALLEKSDASLFILDSNNNPKTRVVFQDAFPVALSGMDFDISTGNTDYFQALATFRYKQFIVEAIA